MYIRTKDGVYEDKNNKVFKYITKAEIVDAGYGKILPKGSFVKIGETWINYYGRWTSIIDKNGNIYDIRSNRVEEVIEEIKYTRSENLEELCDRYVGISNNKPMIIKYEFDEYYDEYGDTYTKEELLMEYDTIYGAIYTSEGLIYVAKMNENGDLELI